MDCKIIDRIESVGLDVMKPPDAPGVYFVAYKEHPEFIKIGKAERSIADRLSQYTCYSPFIPSLVCAMPFPDEEHNWHQRFASYQHRTEWFRLDGELLAFVRAMNGSLWDAFDYPALDSDKYGPCLIVPRRQPHVARAQYFLGWRVYAPAVHCWNPCFVWDGANWLGPFPVFPLERVRAPDVEALALTEKAGEPPKLRTFVERASPPQKVEDLGINIDADTLAQLGVRSAWGWLG